MTRKHTVTIEDLEANPQLVEEGVQVGDEIDIDIENPTAYLDEQMAAYVKAYPNEKEFHVTSDGQVFLTSNKADAQNHQKFLNDGKDVVIYTAPEAE